MPGAAHSPLCGLHTHPPQRSPTGDWQARRLQDLAALDYTETALSEAWEVLRRIAAGDPNPAQVAADLLEAHGHEGIDR